MEADDFDIYYSASYGRNASFMRLAWPNTDEADDAIEAAYNLAWRRRKEFDAEPDPDRWIRRESWRQAVSRRRSGADAPEPRPFSHITPQQAALAAVLSALPERIRRATALTMVTGLGIDDVAREMEISTAKVKSALADGTGSLTRALVLDKDGNAPDLEEELRALQTLTEEPRLDAKQIRELEVPPVPTSTAKRNIIVGATLAALAVTGGGLTLTHPWAPSTSGAMTSTSPSARSSAMNAPTTYHTPRPAVADGPKLVAGYSPCVARVQFPPSDGVPPLTAPGTIITPLALLLDRSEVFEVRTYDRTSPEAPPTSEIQLRKAAGEPTSLGTLPKGFTASGAYLDKSTNTLAVIAVDGAHHAQILTGPITGKLTVRAETGGRIRAVFMSVDQLLWLEDSAEGPISVVARIPLTPNAAAIRQTATAMGIRSQMYGFHDGRIAAWSEAEHQWSFHELVSGAKSSIFSTTISPPDAQKAALYSAGKVFVVTNDVDSPIFYGSNVKEQPFDPSKPVTVRPGVGSHFIVTSTSWDGFYEPERSELQVQPRTSATLTRTLIGIPGGVTESMISSSGGSLANEHSTWLIHAEKAMLGNLLTCMPPK